MLDLYNRANMQAPDRVEPNLPAECVAPKRVEVGADDSSKWTRGVGVKVADPAAGMLFSGVQVIVHFSDQHEEKTETDRHDEAINPMRTNAKIDRVTLKWDGEGSTRKPEIFDITPIGEGIQMIVIDSTKLGDPPFKTMRLLIDGADLQAPDMNGGRYVKH
jgi:hypothetical protein